MVDPGLHRPGVYESCFREVLHRILLAMNSHDVLNLLTHRIAETFMIKNLYPDSSRLDDSFLPAESDSITVT